MKRIMVGLVLACFTSLAFALPSEADVRAAVAAGRYDQAQTMMAEVVAARPQSAKAHYLYAEVLAHNGRFAEASTQVDDARRIDPALSFTDADRFRAFTATLERARTDERSARSTAAPTTAVAPTRAATLEREAAPSRGIPGWVWLVALLAIGAFLWRGFARSRATDANAMGPVAPGAPMGPTAYGPVGGGMGYGAPVAPQGSSAPGSSALRTGMAVAGGVAGGLLLGEMFNRHHDGGSTGDQRAFDGGSTVPADSALGGLVPGSFPSDDAAARDLASRPIDFGNGDDWGGDGDLADSGGGGDDWT